jgi:beta-fructofuranosidase
VLGTSATGPWDVAAARPFVAEPALFAAPLVRQRDGSWALVGFRNTEPEGVLSFELTAPIPVRVGDGGLVAAPADVPSLPEVRPL